MRCSQTWSIGLQKLTHANVLHPHRDNDSKPSVPSCLRSSSSCGCSAQRHAQLTSTKYALDSPQVARQQALSAELLEEQQQLRLQCSTLRRQAEDASQEQQAAQQEVSLARRALQQQCKARKDGELGIGTVIVCLRILHCNARPAPRCKLAAWNRRHTCPRPEQQEASKITRALEVGQPKPAEIVVAEQQGARAVAKCLALKVCASLGLFKPLTHRNPQVVAEHQEARRRPAPSPSRLWFAQQSKLRITHHDLQVVAEQQEARAEASSLADARAAEQRRLTDLRSTMDTVAAAVAQRQHTQ
eukprot:1141203-Pelagomonas_calceolata.AAC.3